MTTVGLEKFNDIADSISNPKLEDNILGNLTKNIAKIAVRFEQLFEILMKDDYETDEEVFGIVDKIGEIYGSLISYVIGFDKRHNGKLHKYRFWLKSPLSYW